MGIFRSCFFFYFFYGKWLFKKPIPLKYRKFHTFFEGFPNLCFFYYLNIWIILIKCIATVLCYTESLWICKHKFTFCRHCILWFVYRNLFIEFWIEKQLDHMEGSFKQITSKHGIKCVLFFYHFKTQQSKHMKEWK